MKKLNTFVRFDAQAFLRGKKLSFVEGRVDTDSDKFNGVRMSLLIKEDNTDYGNGITGANIYEKLSVKVEGQNENYLRQFKLDDEVYIENPVMSTFTDRDSGKTILITSGVVKKVVTKQ